MCTNNIECDRVVLNSEMGYPNVSNMSSEMYYNYYLFLMSFDNIKNIFKLKVSFFLSHIFLGISVANENSAMVKNDAVILLHALSSNQAS